MVCMYMWYSITKACSIECDHIGSFNGSAQVGLYEKQSSFFVQAKTAESRVLSNVFFNGPRAGINMNDGFGGGDELLIYKRSKKETAPNSCCSDLIDLTVILWHFYKQILLI